MQLGIIALYLFGMYFTVRSDKKANPNANFLVLFEPTNATTTTSSSTGDAEDGKTQLTPTTKDGATLVTEGVEGKGSCMGLFMCKNKLMKSDKLTVLLCTVCIQKGKKKKRKKTNEFQQVFSNIVLSTGLNQAEVKIEENGRQFLYGLISGSVILPVMSIITLLYGKMPKQYYTVPYLVSYGFCGVCFIVTMVYSIGMRFRFRSFRSFRFFAASFPLLSL